MASDSEEDFPINGRDKLAKIFKDNTLDDISFKFSIPKHPSSRSSKPALNTIPLKVIHGKTVDAYQLKAGGYVSEGKVGLAIIGNDEYCYYQLYMYKSDEKKVMSAEISFQFSFLVQEHNYASFKDQLDIQWSVHFEKASDIIQFSKEVALARWRSTPSCQCKLIQDAYKGKTDSIVKKSDHIRVNYTLIKLSFENKVNEEVSCKVITAPANSINWDVSLVGACLNSRKFIIIPSGSLQEEEDPSSPQSSHLMLDLEVDEIIPTNNKSSLSSSSLGIQIDTSKRSKENKEDGKKLSERISRIGYALPTMLTPEIESLNEETDNLKLQPRKNSSALLSSTLLTNEESNISLDTSDVTVTSHFNVLFSEVRTTNSEMRMNLSKVNDKIETLISKVETSPQVINKVIPILDKVDILEEISHKIVEQNSAILSLIENNSLSNFQTTLNEVVQLKKRNSELEALLDVAGSTGQILKEKIDELNQKMSFMETNKKDDISICSHCNGGGDRIVKVLEENVRELEKKNLDLSHETKELERQNRELSEQTLSTIQGHSNQELSFQLCLLEKDKRIESLERDIETLKNEVKTKPIWETKEKEVTEVAKALMNKAYKTLKNTCRDPVMIDHCFADALREMTQDYLENYFGRKQIHLYNRIEKYEERVTEENYEQGGKVPLAPSTLPIPIPKPRKQALSLSPNVQTSNESDLSKDKEIISSQLQVVSTNSLVGSINKENNDTNGNQQNSNLVNVNNVKTVNLSKEIQVTDNRLTNNNLDDDIETVETGLPRRTLIDVDTKTELEPTPLITSYSTNYYTPFISNTPPPIMDDISD